MIESVDNNSDVTIESGGQLLVGGLVRAEDALLVKGGESPTGISFVLTPIVNETDDDGDEINAAGNKVSASGGDPVRKSGGVLDVRSGGTITVEGAEDLLLNGMVGRVYVASGSPAVDAASADITSAAGDVFVTGLVNAKDSVTISARDIFVLNEAVVKTRATGSEAFLKATRKVHVTRSPTATERALVEAGKLVHLFGKELQADGTLKTREADARILLNATDDILVTGEVLASDVAELNSGVASDATRTRLEQGFALSDLSGGDVRIFAEAKIDAVTDLLVVAGGNFRLQAFSELGDGTRSLASPYVSQNAETIDVVTGSRQVEDGTMIVERVEWIDTTVTEEVGRELVKVGFTQKEANVTLAQSGYWKPTGTSPSTGTFRKFLVDEAGDSLFGGFSGNDTDSAALADFNSATITGWSSMDETQKWRKALDTTGYFKLYKMTLDGTSANPNAITRESRDGNVTEDDWVPSWKDNAYEIRKIDVEGWNGDENGSYDLLRDKYVILPVGASADISRVISKGEPTTTNPVVGQLRDSYNLNYVQVKSSAHGGSEVTMSR